MPIDPEAIRAVDTLLTQVSSKPMTEAIPNWTRAAGDTTRIRVSPDGNVTSPL